jgi:L-iditol 2-dehydrogenase
VIGQLAVQLAALAGAEVMLVTRQPSKRDLGRELGATATAATAAEALAIWPKGADLVLECAGVAETVVMAPHLTARGGRIVILGVLPKGQMVQIEPFDLLFREITMIHSFLNPFTHARATDLIATGRIRIAPLISRVIPLEEAAAAIANPARPDDVKVVVQP